MTLPDPLSLITLLVSLSLAPFAAMMVTSFIKLVVVINLVRNALGIQQIPPNMVVNGLALILTFYIMAPVAQESLDIMEQRGLAKLSMTQDMPQIKEIVSEAKTPLQEFLSKHTSDRERQFFMNTAKLLWPKGAAAKLTKDDLLILVPAFTVSELTSAFQIGFLLYLPFIVIDLVVSNILLAMGMMMVSPMTISLPFKLLLFVLVSGWTRLIHGLVMTYV